MSSEHLKGIPFELKELSDNGDFVGLASVYGNIDQGGDVVESGAFDVSISKYGSKVRLMDSHRARIGMATVESTPIGLKAIGKINTKKQAGAEALSDLRFYRDNGLPMGMSIGYETIKAVPAHLAKDGARHLEQVRLWEVTITEFPMNERAQVTNVKSISDLIASVKASQVSYKDELLSALCSIACDPEVSEKVASLGESIKQFSEWMGCADFEGKAGRVLSQANRALITKCITDLQALLDMADAKTKEPDEKLDSPTGDAEKSKESNDNLAAEQAMIDKILAELST